MRTSTEPGPGSATETFVAFACRTALAIPSVTTATRSSVVK